MDDLSIHFTRVEDPDQILEQTEFCEKSPDDQQVAWQPYWAEAWAAAETTANELAATVKPDMRVMDLGCGLGLTGAVAAARGARVMMADHAPPALLFAELNTWPWREHVEICRVDWRNDVWTGDRYDLIVGSEVIYDRVDWPYLERFWRVRLADGGNVLLSEGGRLTGDEFSDWIESRGWHVDLKTFYPESRPRRIRLFRLTLK